MSRFPLLSTLLICVASASAYGADRPWWQFWGGVAENATAAAAGSVVNDLAATQFTPEQQRLLRDFLAQERRSYQGYDNNYRRDDYRDHDRGDDRDDDSSDRREHDDSDSDDGHGHKQGKYKDKHKGKYKDLPPGLQKKVARGGDLPPGWQKKLARGEVVDDAVWRESRRLPPDLLDRLGPLPRDTEIRYVEDKVYRVMRNTREIVDILSQ